MSDAPKLTHIDAAGEAHMVDVGDKAETVRVAVAEGFVKMKPETLALMRSIKTALDPHNTLNPGRVLSA